MGKKDQKKQERYFKRAINYTVVMQTKKQSLKESIYNLLVGYAISFISLFLIFPLVGIESSFGKNMLITLYFSVLSIARSYFLRRFFNRKNKN